MKEQWRDQHAELKAELSLLQRKLSALEAAQPRDQRQKSVGWRPGNTVTWLSVALLALLVPGGVIYGQQAMEALFIDSKGNVGIGNASPKATLDVSGKILAKDLEVGTTFTGPKTSLLVNNPELQTEILSLRNTNRDARDTKGVYQSYYVTDRNGGAVEVARISGGMREGSILDRSYLSFARRDHLGRMMEAIGISSAVTVSTDVNVQGALNVASGIQTAGGIKVEGGIKVLPVAALSQGLPFRTSWTFRPPGTKAEPRQSRSIPLDPHCADADGCRVRIRAETFNSEIPFFLVDVNVAVASGGPSMRRQVHMKNDWNEARCVLTDGCECVWLDWGLRMTAKNNQLVIDADGRMTVDITVFDN